MDDQRTSRFSPDSTGSLDRPPSDPLLRLSEVSRGVVPWFPSTSIATLHRYTKHALRGRRVLRTVLIAGIKYTCAQWLWEFCNSANDEPTSTGQRRTPRQRHDARARAAAELADAGI